ncbi:hypothetical protein PHISP_06409 [Aspergillus sp. HF37]|nr:hypothetical protein PHISP_06409 [Aspergillus sp. HF37]
MKPQTAALVISLLAPALAAPVSPTNNGQIENNYSFINPVGSASPPSLSGSQAAAKPSSTSGDNSSGALPLVDGGQIPRVKDTVHEAVGDESKSGQHSANSSPSKHDPQRFGMGGGSSPFGSMSGMGSRGSGGSSSGPMPMPGMGSGGSGGPSGGSPFGSMSGMGSGGSGGSPSGSKPKSGGKGPAPSDVVSSAMGKAFGMGGSGSSGASPSATSSPTSSQPTATQTASSSGGVLDNLDLLEASSL